MALSKVIYDIALKLGIDPKGVEEGIRVANEKIKRGFDKIKKTAKKSENSFKSLRVGIKKTFGAIAVFLGVRKVVQGFRDLNVQLDKLGKASKNLGVGVQFLKELQFAARRSGIEVEGMNVGLQRAIRRMQEFAQTGKGEAAVALKALGGGIAESVRQGATFEKLLPRMADQFSKLTDEQKLFVGFKLFDTEGVKLVTLLFGEGAEHLEKLRSEARLVVGHIGQATNVAADFEDSSMDLGEAFSSLGRELNTVITPALTAANSVALNMVVSLRKEIGLFNAVVSAAKKAKDAGIVEETVFDAFLRIIASGPRFLEGAAGRASNVPARRADLDKDLKWWTRPMPRAQEKQEEEAKQLIGDAPQQFRQITAAMADVFNRGTDEFVRRVQELKIPSASAQESLLGSPELAPIGDLSARVDVIADLGRAWKVFSEEMRRAGVAAEEVIGDDFMGIGGAIDLILPKVQTLGDHLRNQVEQFQVTAEEVAGALLGIGVTFSNAMGQMVVALIFEAENFNEAALRILKSLAASVIQTLASLLAQWIVFRILSGFLNQRSAEQRIGTEVAVAGAAGAAHSVSELGLIGIALAPGFAAAAMLVASGAALAGIASGKAIGAANSYALGGIAIGPQLAVVGDNPSRREAIIPLGGGAGSIFPSVIQLVVDGDVLAERDMGRLPTVIDQLGV